MSDSTDVYISLLRGINVSGHKMIAMKELAALYESLKFRDVKTYIQSGNVLFRGPQARPSKLGTQISRAIQKTFGFDVDVTVRSAEEWASLIERNPFADNPAIDIAKLHVTLLAEPPEAELLEKLPASPNGRDEYRVLGADVYLHCPDGYGRTKLTTTFFEKKLNVRATTRNWNTVLKLRELAESM